MNLSNFMHNVSSVALRSVALHASEYTIDVWNNTLDIEIGGNTYSVIVSVGNHTLGASFAAAVESAIIATHPALANFTVVYTTLTDTILVAETTPTPFTLRWKTGPTSNTSMWKTMGFNLADFSSVLVGAYHEAIGPNRIDLDGPLAIDVFADELKHSIDGPIGRVELKRTREENTAVFQHYNNINEAHTFWPISRITFLTFRFLVQRVVGDGTSLTCDYRPYQFNGRNNTLRIDFGCTEYVNPMEQDVQLDPGTT
jgi:hypothetical protein